MPAINLRNVPEGLVKAIKVIVAREGRTMTGWILEKLQEVVDGVSKEANLPRLSGIDLGEASTGRTRNAPSDSQSESGAVGRSAQEDSGGEGQSKGRKGKLTAEEFFALGNSDRLRATRENRWP